MSTENKKVTVRSSLVVSPEAASDHSTIQHVFDFLQDYVPQAVSGPKEERKERVLWARFETGDLNDLCMPHVLESRGENSLPLLLVLGFSNGFSIWMIMPGGDAREVYFSYGDGETARTVRLLRTPEKVEGVAPDAYADQRPVIAVVKKGRHSSTGSTVAYSTLQLVSLRVQENNEGKVVSKFVFKTRAVVDVQCNRRVVAVVFQKRIVVLCAASLENKFVIKNNYPSSGFPCNPIALGTKWLAFSETKLSSKHQSVGGMSHTTTSSVATTMLKNVRKGITALTETISGLTAKAQGTSMETPDRSHQEVAVACANMVTVVDTGLTSQQQEMKLQDLGKEGAVVAHFMAHAGPDVHIASLAFNPSGHLLVSASTEGHSFHVFQLLPHPVLSSETAVHHLYTLYRGATSGVVQDISFSSDSRWVAVSTLKGTTHVFPISPYGGEPTVRTHTTSRVVNKMSQFHTSAGMDSITDQYRSHEIAVNPKNSLPKSSQSQISQSPPTSNSRDSAPNPSSSSSSSLAVLSYMNGYNSWSNPRSLPLPTPVSMSALQQIKQPYQSSSVVGGVNGRGSGTREGVATSSSSARVDAVVSSGGGGEPYVALTGPDAVCVRAVFGEPGDAGQGGIGSTEDGATYSLYILGSNGTLVEHHLAPQKLSTAPEGEDAPIELAHCSKLCWRLVRNPSVPMAPGSLPLPLMEDNPLIAANDLYRKFSSGSEVLSDRQQGSSEFTPSSGSAPLTLTDDKWLSQVEIQTHAPPSRRLWMGPQFSFKPYQSLHLTSPGVSNSISSADLIKTPSPPNTIIYSSSLNSSLSSNLHGNGSNHHGNGRPGEQLFPGSAESPLLDMLSESFSSSEMHGVALNSCPLAVPVSVAGRSDGGQEGGILEVFESWNKVAPQYEGAPFQGEVERQLQDAMGEQEASSVVVTQDFSVKTGFSPPGP